MFTISRQPVRQNTPSGAGADNYIVKLISHKATYFPGHMRGQCLFILIAYVLSPNLRNKLVHENLTSAQSR